MSSREETGPGDIAPLPTSAPTKIELEGSASSELFDRELRNVELTGSLRHHRTAPACNIVEAIIRSFNADFVDFTRCDFKDTAIRDSRFVHSDFRSSSFAYNAVFNSQFEDSSFSDTAIHSCEFIDVQFIRCDLTNVLVKSSTFQRCTFTNCATNNKLFETCRFANCTFRDTELQVQTIEENFGLTQGQYEGMLRDNRGDEPHRKVDVSQLRALLDDRSRLAMARLLIYYFLNESLIEGSPYLDAVLSLESWLPVFRTAGSFAVVLTQWVQFVLWLYERDELLAQVVIVLHTMIGRLLRELTKQDSEHQALTAIRGAFASLARVVDDYITAVSSVLGMTTGRMRLVVDGEGYVEFYERELAPLLDRDGARIVKFAPYNSWELIVTFALQHPLGFVALLMAASTRLNITQHIRHEVSYFMVQSPAEAFDAMESRSFPHESACSDAAASLPTFGESSPPPSLHRDVKGLSEYRLMAYQGSDLTREFNIGLSTEPVGRIWKVVKRFESLLPDDS